MPKKIVAVAARAKGVDPPAIEAPYVVFRDGFYYLFVSWDFCCAGVDSTYKIVVGRSKSVLGPYVDIRGRPMADGGGSLITASSRRWRGPGHNSVLHTDRGDWLVHHAYDANDVTLGRVLQIRPLYWIDGWPSGGQPLDKPLREWGRNPSPKNISGRWRHGVDYALSMPIELGQDGTLKGSRATGTFSRDGSSLVLRWKDTKAPGGVWVDRVTIEPDGDHYVGRNQRGQVVVGTRD